MIIINVNLFYCHFTFCDVPVLSLQIIVVEPSVSTAGNRLINAFFLAILYAPIVSEVVIIAGSASGIAATAKLILQIRISREQVNRGLKK